MQKEGAVGVFAAVLFEKADGPVGEGVGGVEVRTRLDAFLVEVEWFEGEIVSTASGTIDAVEAPIYGMIAVVSFAQPADVPFTGVIRAISALLQQFGDRMQFSISPSV